MSKKTTLLLLTLAVLIGIFSLYTFSIVSVNTTKRPVVSQQIIYQDQVILEKLKSIGAKYTDKVSLEYVDDINSLFATYKRYPSAVSGLYDSNRQTIYIKNGITSHETTIIAHEYLHYVWYSYISQSEKNTIIELSKQIIAQDKYLSNRIQSRISNDTYTDDELFPMVCTEVPDKNILAMVEICNKYIDRSKLTF